MSETNSILKPEELLPASELTRKALEQLDRVLLGRRDLHRLVLAGIMSKGHVLLEGLPGLGKTALVKTVGQILRLDFKRIQFTPDLMPGDILGTHILQQTDSDKREMVFQPGPVFTNILLADEINRASPKTQSALLETMQENCVTLLGTTRPLPQPFFVLASQNPIELEGTYPLPEAQLDRFLFKLIFENSNTEVLDQIIGERRRGELPQPTWQMSREELSLLFKTMDRVFLPRPVSRYIARLISATHPGAAEATEAVNRYMSYGASPRAAIAIAEAARAHALISGRPSVGFEDVKIVAQPVLNHRLLLNYQARFDRMTTSKLVSELLGQLDETGLKLPAGVEVAAKP
jgi:MoxR-like ATPase